MIKQFTLIAALTATLFAGPALADGEETPKAISGAKVISVDEGKALSGAKAAAFFDTRSALNFGKGHVPGAVTASYKEKSEKVEAFDASKDDFDIARLPADKGAKVVFYSDGPSGWKSYKAAVLAVRAGYKNVMYMRGGFAEWESKGYAVER
jgi:rhodanese-related sulfurtransferase